MSFLHKKSIFHANKSLILGHISSGMGEKTHCLKLQWLLDCPLFDIFELFQEHYEPIARLNYALAECGYPILEDLSLPELKKITSKLPPSEFLFLLSWNFSLACAFGAGLHKDRKVIAKLYAHHENEKIFPSLYEPANLLITESLLASERAIKYNILPEKVLFLPHYYPEICEKIPNSRTYVENLAKKVQKKIKKETLIVGTVSRLEYGKNCEYALEAIRHLWQMGKDIVLVLKGNFSCETPYPDYQVKLSQLLEAYDKEPWLLWDKENTPFPDVLHQYASFDMLLHPSGAEAGSHVITEFLGLKKPVLALHCSTNPYLFKDLVTFVKTTGKVQMAQLPFYIPDMEDLIEKLKAPLFCPDEKEVQKRFHPETVRNRFELVFKGKPDEIKRLYDDDRKLFKL